MSHLSPDPSGSSRPAQQAGQCPAPSSAPAYIPKKPRSSSSRGSHSSPSQPPGAGGFSRALVTPLLEAVNCREPSPELGRRLRSLMSPRDIRDFLLLLEQ